MEGTKTVWGGVVGKVIATMLVLAIVCGAVAATLAYTAYGESLLSKEEIKNINVSDNKNGTLSIKFRVDKEGYRFSSFKTEKDGETLIVKLYSSIRGGDTKANSAGVYTITVRMTEDMKSVVQEGPGGEKYTLVKLNIE